jgi:hypothetical protein
MALTELQKKVMRLLATNRSETSYLAGGLLLNRDWPRGFDDIDYVMSAPIKIIGLLAVDPAGIPIEVTDESLGEAILRKATDEPELMPSPAGFDVAGWTGTRP